MTDTPTDRAALTAQAERIEELGMSCALMKAAVDAALARADAAEAMLREAGEVLEPLTATAILIDVLSERDTPIAGDVRVSIGRWLDGMFIADTATTMAALRAARALDDKIRGRTNAE